MTTSETLTKALNILNDHDFYWMMDDFAYTNGTKESARANMRLFVETISELPTELYELMKSLWMATYNYCGCFRPCWTSEDAPKYKAEKEIFTEQVNALIAA